MTTGQELSTFLRSQVFGQGTAMDQEFDREDIELSRRMIYIAGPLFFSWLFIDWLYDPSRFWFYLLLRATVWSLTSFLAYTTLSRPESASPAAKPLILSLFSIGYFIGIALYPDQGVSASMVGGVIINIGIASLVLWRPAFFALYIFPFAVIQQLILYVSGKPLDLIVTNVVVTNITVGFGVFFTRSRYELFKQSHRRKEEISRARDEISVSQKKLRTVLDSIDEAIISIDGSLKIGEDFSRGAAVLFSREKLTNASLASAVFAGSQLSEEETSIVINALTMSIGNSSLMWDLNSHTLPLELRVKHRERQKIFSLLWSPIVDEIKTEISGIVLSVRDETEKLESKLQDEVSHAEIDQRMVITRELIESNVPRSIRLVADTQAALEAFLLSGSSEGGTEAPERNGFLRSLHTCKGVARSLGLSLLSTTIHQLELKLQSLQTSSKVESVADKIEANCSFLILLLNQYQKVLNLFQSSPSAVENNSVAVILNRIIPDIQESLSRQGFSRASFALTEDLPESFSEDDYQMMELLLVHGLRNAADHGFILPLKNGIRAVKDRSPKFQILIKKTAKTTEMRITDNGRGLDWAKIRAIASSRSYSAVKGEDLTAVLFQDGVTTAGQETQTSGQGVGLAAVQDVLTKRGGRASLSDAEGGIGTTLSMNWVAKDLPVKNFITRDS